MLVAPTGTGEVREKRRYVKVPETAEVKRLRDLWLSEAGDIDPLTQVFGALKASHRMAVGRFRGNHWYATVTNDNAAPLGMPDALSGWGETPYQAVAELAFRWHVLMRGSWHPKAWNLKALPCWVQLANETDKEDAHTESDEFNPGGTGGVAGGLPPGSDSVHRGA